MATPRSWGLCTSLKQKYRRSISILEMIILSLLIRILIICQAGMDQGLGIHLWSRKIQFYSWSGHVPTQLLLLLTSFVSMFIWHTECPVWIHSYRLYSICHSDSPPCHPMSLCPWQDSIQVPMTLRGQVPWLLRTLPVPQTPLVCDAFPVLKNTSQVFCRMSLSWDLSDFFLMIRTGPCSSGRPSQRYTAILITSGHGYMPSA